MHRNMQHILRAGTVALLAGAAHAGTYSTAAFSDHSGFISEMTSVHGGFASAPLSSATATTMSFAQSGTLASVGANDSGSFYLGAASALNPIWYNSGSHAPTPDTTVLAFGNINGAPGQVFDSTSVTISFNPNVRGFGFNYDDIEVSSLTIVWSDGDLETLHITPANGGEGFVWFVASAGQWISSITLNQDNPNADDGFSFYNFQVAVVPLPPAAWAGLAMLGGVAGVRKLRRR